MVKHNIFPLLQHLVAVPPTTTPVATTISPSSSSTKIESYRPVRKRKAMRVPPAAAPLPKRVSTRQHKGTSTSAQHEVIIIFRGL
jgi:hypothetical protein